MTYSEKITKVNSGLNLDKHKDDEDFRVREAANNFINKTKETS